MCCDSNACPNSFLPLISKSMRRAARELRLSLIEVESAVNSSMRTPVSRPDAQRTDRANSEY